MKHLKIRKFPFKKRNCLGHRVQNVLENSAKISLPWLHFKTDRGVLSWRKQGWIPRRTISWWKASLPLPKESWAFFWTFSFHFLSFNDRFIAKRKSRWPCDACVIHALRARRDYKPRFARKNNFGEIHISQGLDWAFLDEKTVIIFAAEFG